MLITTPASAHARPARAVTPTTAPTTRSARLLQLVDELRRHRFPVSGAQLAQAMGVSLRTLYRDIATLQAQGAPIEGEAGIGYVLRPGFMPPSPTPVWPTPRATPWPASPPCCPPSCAAH